MPDVAPKSPGFRRDEERSLARLARLERAASCLEGAASTRYYKVFQRFTIAGKCKVLQGKGDGTSTRRERIFDGE